MTPAIAARPLTVEPARPWADLTAALARQPIVPAAPRPATEVLPLWRTILQLQRTRSRPGASRPTSSTSSRARSWGGPASWSATPTASSACWSTITPITAAPRPASASCARSSATGCSWPRAVRTGSTSGGPPPPHSRPAASTSRRPTSSRSQTRRWPNSPPAAPVPSTCCASSSAWRSRSPGGRSSRKAWRARYRGARCLRALWQLAARPSFLDFLLPGGSAEPARRGAPLARRATSSACSTG